MKSRIIVVLVLFFSLAHAFSPHDSVVIVGTSSSSSSSTTLFASLHSNNNNKGRSKRQERVGHLVQTELSRILHTGLIKGRNVEYLDDNLRQRISVVRADVSPDLKQARVSVSITTPKITSKSSSSSNSSSNSNNNKSGAASSSSSTYSDAAVDKRRAYSWLVRNTKPIRHSLAQRMSHLKTCPDLTFVQVDVSAAVDVMYLIDRVAAGYKRQDLGDYNNAAAPSGVVGGIDLDQAYNEDEWTEEDDFDL